MLGATGGAGCMFPLRRAEHWFAPCFTMRHADCSDPDQRVRSVPRSLRELPVRLEVSGVAGKEGGVEWEYRCFMHNAPSVHWLVNACRTFCVIAKLIVLRAVFEFDFATHHKHY
jgi:hypothetical protein